jgi:hypothetical protein
MKSETPSKALSQEILAAIGEALTSCSALEAALTRHLIHFVAHHPRTSDSYLNAFAITAGMHADTAVGVLKTFVRADFPNVANDFDELGDRIIKAHKSRRNTIAHKMWAPASQRDRVKVWDVKTVGTVKMETREITVIDLKSWAADFRALVEEVDEFMLARGLLPLSEVALASEPNP